MPTPPSSPLALCACALLRSGRRSLACSREKREREREREHTRGRETQTERRPAAAKGCTQGLSIAELKEEREARLLLVKQKHISLWKCKEGWWPIAAVAIWLERHRHTHRDRERKRGTERHTDRVFFFGVGGWVSVCRLRALLQEREFVWGARKHEWVEFVKSGFFLQQLGY